MDAAVIAKILIHVSAFLVLLQFFAIVKMRKKQRIHYVSLALVALIFIWNISLISEMYVQGIPGYSGMVLTNICFSAVSYVSVCVFYLGLSFASSFEFKKRYYLLLVFPTITNIMLWTNNLHHLFFVRYSRESSEIIRGPAAYAQLIYAYVVLACGLALLVYFSIKNAGFFSKQSVLIAIGTALPVVVDIAFVFQLVPSFSIYYEPISFSFAVFCYMFAILKYDFLSVVPMALQTVVDHISDSYVVVNENFEIIDYNKPFFNAFANVAAFRRKTSIWSLLEQIKDISTDHLSQFMLALDQTTKNRESTFCEEHFVNNEFDRYFAVEITPVITNQNRYKGTIILLKDITELTRSFELVKQTQAQLIEREHLVTLGQLVGGIAHNLKTPIMSVSGGLEGLSDLITEFDESIDDPRVVNEDYHNIAADMRDWIKKMKSYSSYMSDIISAVKGQAVQLTASTTDQFELNELLKRIEILMNHELKKYGCKLNVACNVEKSIMIGGEVNSLVQVINNLISNSIDAYEGKAGVIDFTISREDAMLRLSVRDYGCGMQEDVRKKLFKEMITTKAKKGTGLGVYMSYSTIIGKFGGQMWFESEVGRGTNFIILIPLSS